MLHDQYEDFNPEYVASIFRARKNLVSSLDDTLLPDNGLQAAFLLDDEQMKVVRNIRTRRLKKKVLSRFIPD